MHDVPRRRFLAGLGATAATPAVTRLRIPARGQAAPGPFSWGVASFDPTTDSVLLWTRVTPPSGGGSVALRWRVAADEALTAVMAEGDVTVDGDTDHCARVEVTSLADGTRWWFAFTAPDGTQSPVGRTCTLPTRPERLRLGVASCARYADGGYAAYRALAERDVDLVVHVGDYIYEDGFAAVRTHEPARRLTTLADYRVRYAQHRSDADLQALHARHPMVAVWDDHDVAGNAWRDGATGHQDGRDGPWLARLRAAGRAHEEWLPGRTATGEDGRLRAWRALGLGELAELVVLDTRTWGRDRQPASEAELEEVDGGPHRQMLGEDQLAFARERLERDDRPPWVFVANQVMLHPLEIPAVTSSLADTVRAGGYLIRDGSAINPDQWDGYPTARAELQRAMGGRGGVVVLTGDVHSSWGWEGPANDGGRPTSIELVTPSVSSLTFSERIPVPAAIVEVGLQTIDRDLSHVDLSEHGYLLVDCTPERVQAEWWYVDPDVPGSQRFGAARSAPLEPPMDLVAEDEPTRDRDGTSAPGSATGEGAGSDGGSADDGPPWGPIGIGAGAGVAAVAATLALRNRRRLR